MERKKFRWSFWAAGKSSRATHTTRCSLLSQWSWMMCNVYVWLFVCFNSQIQVKKLYCGVSLSVWDKKKHIIVARHISRKVNGIALLFISHLWSRCLLTIRLIPLQCRGLIDSWTIIKKKSDLLNIKTILLIVSANKHCCLCKKNAACRSRLLSFTGWRQLI